MTETAPAPPDPAVVDRIASATIENWIWLLKEMPTGTAGPLRAEIAAHGQPHCDPYELIKAVHARIEKAEISYRLAEQADDSGGADGTGERA